MSKDAFESRVSDPQRQTVAAGEYDEAWLAETWGWDSIDEFVRSGGTNLRPRVRRAIDLASIRPGMRILDVGCGRGEVVLECARRGASAVGADYSSAAIAVGERALVNSTPEVQERVRLVLGDVKEIDPAIGRFDRIFLLDLVEHLYDWELLVLFESLERLLAPGGQLIIHTLPNKWVYDVTYSRIIRFFAPWLDKNPRGEKEMAIHVNEMSITHLDQLMRRSGFTSDIWLEEQITGQARWHAKAPLGDRRGALYRWMNNPVVSWLYRLAARTPARFLIVNDIFCIGSRQGERSGRTPWRGWMERLVCAAGRRLAPWRFEEPGT